jgi:isopenicillin N synthase-like dioxygenase
MSQPTATQPTPTLPTATLPTHGVPVIDVAGFADPGDRDRVVAEIGAACERVGFVVLTGHGVDPALVDRMYDVSRRFFAMPEEVKRRFVSPSGSIFRGYAGLAEFALAGGRNDLVEAFEISRYDSVADVIAAGYAPEWTDGYEGNIWPDVPSDFEVVWRAYYAAMEQLAGRLMDVFAAALDLPAGWFDDKFDRHTSYLSANCYPGQAVPPQEGQIRRSEHTDIGSLTILYQDGAPGGLQVFDRDGRWCDVPAVAGSFVINLGDMLAKWTNDRWVATQHRVVNPPPEFASVQRISIPFFQHPNFDALIECIPSCQSPDRPARYPAVLSGNWSQYRMSLES